MPVIYYISNINPETSLILKYMYVSSDGSLGSNRHSITLSNSSVSVYERFEDCLSVWYTPITRETDIASVSSKELPHTSADLINKENMYINSFDLASGVKKKALLPIINKRAINPPTTMLDDLAEGEFLIDSLRIKLYLDIYKKEKGAVRTKYMYDVLNFQ